MQISNLKSQIDRPQDTNILTFAFWTLNLSAGGAN